MAAMSTPNNKTDLMRSVFIEAPFLSVCAITSAPAMMVAKNT
jgi:hypothetical protein